MTKENELLNFFKVAYANYPIDKNYLYKLVKETPEIITAFDPQEVDTTLLRHLRVNFKCRNVMLTKFTFQEKA